MHDKKKGEEGQEEQDSTSNPLTSESVNSDASTQLNNIENISQD